jgi:hypothetical protein
VFEINLRSDVGVYMWTQLDLGYLCGSSFDVSMIVTETVTVYMDPILYVDPISKCTQFDDDDDESMIVIEIVK